MEEFPYSQIEKYLDLFFENAALGTLIGVVSLIYAFYLFKKSRQKHRLIIMTMSNGQREEIRKTEIVLYNDGPNDITKNMLIDPSGLMLKFKKYLKISDIRIAYRPDSNKYQLKEKKANYFKLKFDILKSKEAIVVKLFHDSSKHMDEVWRELEIVGTIADVAVLRDDFSDQMVRRAHSVDIPIYFATGLSTIVLTYIFRLFIKTLPWEISTTYLLIISFILSFFTMVRWFLVLVGDREYKIFWRFIKKSRKEKE